MHSLDHSEDIDDDTELSAHEQRVLFAESRPDGDASSFDDHEIEDWWSTRPRGLRRKPLHLLSRSPHTSDAEDATPLSQLAPRHTIAFLVLDGAGEPYPGLPYVLDEGAVELERASLGKDATVRKPDVVHDDFRLRLLAIETVAWIEEGARFDDVVSLAITTCGVADGTSLDVLLFEELREHDDDVLVELSATVTGDAASATWTVQADALTECETVDGKVHLVAEVRGPDGIWAKTSLALPVEQPAIVSAQWATPVAKPGEPVVLQVATRGLADGTCVAFDVYRVRLSGEDEHLETTAELPIAGGAVATEWTPPDATVPAEYWFSASIVEPVVCSVASTLLHAG